jgi:hypothetical protein
MLNSHYFCDCILHINYFCRTMSYNQYFCDYMPDVQLLCDYHYFCDHMPICYLCDYMSNVYCFCARIVHVHYSVIGRPTAHILKFQTYCNNRCPVEQVDVD